MRASFVIGMVGVFLGLQAVTVHAADVAQPAPPFVVPVGGDGIQRAAMTLDSYSYTPNHLVVESGKPVELTLTSATIIMPHNFLIKELSIEQDVSAGKTVVVKFTPAQPGLFSIYCDKRLWPMPSHRDKGMEGTLEVK